LDDNEHGLQLLFKIAKASQVRLTQEWKVEIVNDGLWMWKLFDEDVDELNIKINDR